MVEGQSELIFYKTLAKQIGIDLDRLNISILSVEGVGFYTYAKILGALGIYWVARTDNDIFKIQHQDAYRFAGIERGLELAKQSCDLEETDEKVIDAYSCKIHGFVDKNSIPSKVLEAADKLRDVLANYDIFIADVDFETDLCNGPLKMP